MSAKSHLKSLAKVFSWRLIGAADSFAIAYFVTGHATAAVGFVGLEILTKSVWYYAHERAWEHPVMVAIFGAMPSSSE
jgi:uncharacterized membrane protein